ncbi:MAG: hypothetical protein KGL54_11490 [Sphingomonadales bacterium]|nr:hypothetical protein [Sphingomonadales bacterium]
MAALALVLAAPAAAAAPSAPAPSAASVPSAPIPAATPVFRAGQLHVWCNREKFANPSESEQFFFCMGYIIATVEARLTVREAEGASPCLPADVYGSKFIDMAVDYMRRHGDRLNEPAPRLILESLYEAHPACR